MDANHQIETLPPQEWDALIGEVLKRYRHLCGDDALIDNEDLQQEAWIALLKASQDYDPNKRTKFTTFAYDRIRYHLCGYITKRLENKPTQIAEDPFDYIDQCDIKKTSYRDQSIEQRDLVRTIFGAIADEQHAHLLQEHFVRGLSYRKLATMYQCSHETIGTRINRLLALLEKRLDKNNE